MAETPPTSVTAEPSSPTIDKHASGTGCTASFRAQVVDADAHGPIAGARVELRPPRSRHAVYLQSDESGYVQLDQLCAGPMRIATVEVHHANNSQIVLLGEEATSVTIELTSLHDYHNERVVVVHGTGPKTMAAGEDIAGAELARTRGTGLAEAVSRVAGVTTLQGTGGGMAKPVIRGQVGRRNLIVFDGIRHEGQKWGLDHAPEIDPYAAGRITVIKGAATTRFGADAIGGAVLLDPRPLPRTPSISGEVSTVGMSNALGGGGAVRFDHAPSWARHMAYRVEGNAARHRAALAPDYPLDNTGTFNWNVGTRLGYLRDRFDVVAGYRILRTEAGICTCLHITSPEEFEQTVAAKHPPNADLYSHEFAIERAKQEIWHHLALLRTRVALGRGGELHATYAYQFNDRQEFEIARSDITGPQLSFALGTHTGEVRYEHAAVALSRSWSLVGIVGAHVTRQLNDFDAAVSLIPDYAQWSQGAFAVERFVHDRIELEIGGRYEGLERTAFLTENDFSGQAKQGRLDLSRCEDTSSGGARCEQTFHTPSSTAGMLVRPIARVPELDWRVELNSSARIPAIDEHYMNGAAPSFPLLGIGNAKLGVERTWGGATSLQYDGAWLHTDASAYGNYVDDYVYFRPEPQEGQCAPLTCTASGPLPVYAFRPIDAAFVGGELHIDLLAPHLPFEVSGNAAWIRAFDLTHDGPVTLMPADRYSLAGRYRWPDTRSSSQGFLEISGTYIDQQRRYDAEADFAPPPPAAVLLGAAAGLEFPFAQNLLRVSLEGKNLLNQRYREYTSLLRYFADEPGWSVRLRVAVEFDLVASNKTTTTVTP